MSINFYHQLFLNREYIQNYTEKLPVALPADKENTRDK